MGNACSLLAVGPAATIVAPARHRRRAALVSNYLQRLRIAMTRRRQDQHITERQGMTSQSGVVARINVEEVLVLLLGEVRMRRTK